MFWKSSTSWLISQLLYYRLNVRSSEWCGFQECFFHYSTLSTSLKSCHFDLDSNFQFTTDAQTIVKMNLTASGLGLAADCRVDLFPRRPDVEFCGHALVSLRLGYTSVKLKSMSLCQRCYCIAKVCRRWAEKNKSLINLWYTTTVYKKLYRSVPERMFWGWFYFLPSLCQKMARDLFLGGASIM